MTAEYDTSTQDQGNSPEQTMVIHDPRLEQTFTQVPHEVVFMRGLSLAAKQAYTVLLTYAWKHNRCFPGMARLCEDLEASAPTTRKLLAELVAFRLIRIERRGLQKTNLYHFLPVGEAGPPALHLVPTRPMSPDRKTRFHQERKTRFRPDGKTVSSPESNAGSVLEGNASLHPIEEEEYSEVRILRGTKGRSATHVAGADAPPTARKQPRPRSKTPPAVDKDEGSRETPQYRVFVAYCTAMGADVADMDGRKGRACADATRFLGELTKRYADDPAAGTDAEADLCAMLRWKAGDLKTKRRDVLTLTVRAAYEDQAGWRKAGCPYRPEPPEDEGESFYGHKKGTAAYRMFHDDPVMNAGLVALWAKHDAEMAAMNGAH